MQTAATILPILSILDTLPAHIQAHITLEVAQLWAAHFQAEAEAEQAAGRAAAGSYITAHVLMARGPKFHGGKCACGESLPRFKSAPFFNTVERKLVCSSCYQAGLDALTARAFYERRGC